jgi:hypothetical protein
LSCERGGRYNACANSTGIICPHDVPHAYCCCTSRRENTCPATSQGQVGLKDSSPSNHPLIIRTRRPPGRPSVPHSQQRLSTSNQWMRPCCNVQFSPSKRSHFPHSAGPLGREGKNRRKESTQDLGRGYGNWDERSYIQYQVSELCGWRRTSTALSSPVRVQANTSTSQYHDPLCSLPRA